MHACWCISLGFSRTRCWQCVRGQKPALFSPAENTMQLFMWQLDTVGVAHDIVDCFHVLCALNDAPDDASTSSPSALAAGWKQSILSLLGVRPGCDADTTQLLKEFDRVVYISCNPETLHANLLELGGTHAIRRFAIFDQFPYTEHIECGVYLQRKPDAVL